MTFPTEKQATQWLAALDNLASRERSYREMADCADLTYKWEREAIFRLRGLLIAVGGLVEDEKPA